MAHGGVAAVLVQTHFEWFIQVSCPIQTKQKQASGLDEMKQGPDRTRKGSP